MLNADLQLLTRAEARKAAEGRTRSCEAAGAAGQSRSLVTNPSCSPPRRWLEGNKRGRQRAAGCQAGSSAAASGTLLAGASPANSPSLKKHHPFFFLLEDFLEASSRTPGLPSS